MPIFERKTLSILVTRVVALPVWPGANSAELNHGWQMVTIVAHRLEGRWYHSIRH